MEGEFSKKWGLMSHEMNENDPTLCVTKLVLGQLVIVILCLYFIRPSFVMDRDSHLTVPCLNLFRLIAFAVIITLGTYFYPMIFSR